MTQSIGRLKYVRVRDVFACFVFILILPIALIAKLFIHNFWLVGEEKNEARDNGYWFFKYVREKYPKQRIAYVINKNCSDYEKVKDLGKVVNWGGITHWFWYMVAKKNISSQKGCKPNAAACFLFEIKLRLWRNKRCFLQHGVTKDDADWLYYHNCRFALFVCGAKPEFEFVKKKFGYPDGVVQYCGFTRFDNLQKQYEKKKQILVMPTWREYLVRPNVSTSASDLKGQFTSTEYYKRWAELICSQRLQMMLERNGYKLLFFPHRNMQIYLDCFQKLAVGQNVLIANPNKIDVQTALLESALILTDYSSVFFDFAYMKKPIIFYQFDEKEFREHQYKQGYFDYHNNVLGRWCERLDDCLELVENELDVDCQNHDNVSDFFELYDDQNCERNYQAVVFC